jgi:hypothetical protein
MNYTKALNEDTNRNYTLTRHPGTSYQLKITVKDKDGTAVNITGKTVACFVRKYINDANLIAENATILNQSTYLGSALWQITPTMTGTTLSRGKYIMGFTYTHDTAIIEQIIGSLVIE